MNTSNPAHRFLPCARISPRTALWSALTGVALVLPALYVINLLAVPPNPSQSAAAAARAASIPLWMLALKAVILMPVLEEVFYRGILLQLLRRYLPLWAALIPPTLIFGITHLGFSAQNALFAGLVGLYFSWLMIRTGSLLPAMLCHAAINLFVVFLLRPLFAGDPSVNPSMLHEPLPLLMLAVSLGVSIYGVRRLHGATRTAARKGLPAAASPQARRA